MKAFEYANPTTIKDATALLAKSGSKPMAGGIDLLGELKDYIRTPNVVVNLKKLPGLNAIKSDGKGIHIGALVTLDEIAHHATIKSDYTALAEAAGLVGSPQIRNVGTLGGNLCQRPRCWYYRDEAVICLKKGGSTCYAVSGENEHHAILGGGPSFIVHPSDCAPALIALGATVDIHGPNGKRTIPVDKLFVLPTENVLQETVLKPGEIVTEIHIPKPVAGTKSHYMKVRHKEGFDWALSGAAVSLVVANGVAKNARVVLSGVAPIPWRATEAELAINGKAVTEATALAAGKAAVAKARPLGKNGYKVGLTTNVVKLALLHVAG
jgi:xanthine dehydrogenase YagS FAD-binding subunit